MGSLERLAETMGVALSYHDIQGNLVTASREALSAVLEALGADVSSEAAIADSIAREVDPAQRGPIEEVIVAWDGHGFLRARVGPGEKNYELVLLLEDGDAIECSGSLDEVPHDEDGARIPLPALPFGYHDLRFSTARAQATALVLSAPRASWEPEEEGRHFGVFAPLYALRTARGPANLGDLERLIEWSADRGASLVGTLPLLASFLDEPFEPSPYVPVSRLFWNELYLDVGALAEHDGAPIPFAAEGTHADHRARMANKRPAIERAAARMSGARKAAFAHYVDTHPRLDDYARFRAAAERHRATWQSWPSAARDGRLRPGDYDEAARHYHLYAQWNLHLQLEGLAERSKRRGLGLYLDLPVGAHGGGYDLWRERELFMSSLGTGAPPDGFFTGGQNWGFPPLHPRRIRRDRYRYVRAMLRNHFRYAGVLRIDHVMGLHRLFCIPHGMAATSGVYVSYRAEELWAIVNIESHRSRTMVVGEDLGTVPDAVRDAMAEHRARGMHVAQFGLRDEPEAAVVPPKARSVASINTHDTPTFAAFAGGLDIEDQRRRGWISATEAETAKAARAKTLESVARYLASHGLLEEDRAVEALYEALLLELGRSAADIVLVNLEDVLGETHPQNVPGTSDPEPNWRHLAKASLEDLARSPRLSSILEHLSAARRGAERSKVGAVHRSGLTALDLHLFNEGTLHHAYKKLGAHPDGKGTRFAVWAPNAERVAVIGDFNGWDSSAHLLTPCGNSGIWEGYVPGVGHGAIYKYHLVSRHHGYRTERADPYGFRQECPPRTASVVWDLDYAWRDQTWMATRSERNALDAPIAIYEVHFGSWMRVPEEGDRALGYRELAPRLAAHVKHLGFTHVELMPIMEHPFYGSWGYQVGGYFAPTSRYGTPQDFMYFVDHLHAEGIGVILDWVPSHFPNDGHALAYFDGTHLYEHADPRQGFHPDWKTSIFNLGRNEVQSFLISNALFWLDKYHLDGLRVDAVASMLYLDYSRTEGQWVPNRYGGRENLESVHFLRRLNEVVYDEYPDVQTIAEESTSWEKVSRPTFSGGLGFGLKWDMGWMHDTLQYMRRDPAYRRWHHDELTFRMMYAFYENFVLSLSHDEVVHGKGSLLSKMPGDPWQQRANLRLLYGYMFAQPGKKLLFMGQEFGQRSEWNHDRSLDWHLLHDEAHRGLLAWVAALGHLYRGSPALYERETDWSGFEWIDFRDADHSVISLLRRGEREVMVAVFNFTPLPRHDYRVGLPEGGRWRERLNSDDPTFGGSGVANGERHADAIGWQGRPHSASISLPPLGCVFLEPVR